MNFMYWMVQAARKCPIVIVILSMGSETIAKREMVRRKLGFVYITQLLTLRRDFASDIDVAT